MGQSLPSPKCERTIIHKKHFHKQSFRWAHRGDVHLLIGCPLVLDRGGKKIKTKWVAKAREGSQCQVAPSGAKAGTRVHNIVLATEGGACKDGYKRR